MMYVYLCVRVSMRSVYVCAQYVCVCLVIDYHLIRLPDFIDCNLLYDIT